MSEVRNGRGRRIRVVNCPKQTGVIKLSFIKWCVCVCVCVCVCLQEGWQWYTFFSFFFSFVCFLFCLSQMTMVMTKKALLTARTVLFIRHCRNWNNYLPWIHTKAKNSIIICLIKSMYWTALQSFSLIGNPSDSTKGSEMIENVQIIPFSGFLLFCQQLYKPFFFWSCFIPVFVELTAIL